MIFKDWMGIVKQSKQRNDTENTLFPVKRSLCGFPGTVQILSLTVPSCHLRRTSSSL